MKSDPETQKLLDKHKAKLAAMTPEEKAAYDAKLKRREAGVAEMVEGLNAYTAKK